LKIVVDTNVLVSALIRSEGIPARILDVILSRQAKTVLDHRIYLEYEEVLLRPEFGFSRELVNDLLDFLWLSSERVRVATMSVELLPDADDTKFLEVAMTASADFLITGNLRHFPARQRHGVHVVSPREWWKLWSEHPS
jgi:putative PIN family toxin of toxin-antitoxin system